MHSFNFEELGVLLEYIIQTANDTFDVNTS